MSTCATASRDLDEPLAGTAATATTWLLLEQPGPWGAKALTSSHLDHALGAALEAAAAGTGVRIALIRRPGRHADRHSPAERQVFAAHVRPDGSGSDSSAGTAQHAGTWLHSAVLTDPARLLGLDFAALGRGEAASFDARLAGRAHTGEPLALVCTNGKRDRCCALLGRPLAAELAAAGASGTWEVTHLGGHRFSPTLLVLPYGYAYGRLDAPAVKQVLTAVREGRVVTEGCRGNSAWDRPGQAAELAVRTAVGEERAGVLTVVRSERADVRGAGTHPDAGGHPGPGAHPAAEAAPRWRITLAHADGRAWTVTVEQGAAGPPRPESCGGALGSPARMDVVALQELAGV